MALREFDMSMYRVLRTARCLVVDGPLIRPSRLKWERQQFLAPHNLGAHYGVYRSFAEARSQLPSNPGFNLGSLAHEYVRVRGREESLSTTTQ